MSALRLVPPVGSPIEVQGDRALVGREPSADIVVNDPSVSRRHAVLERRPEGWAVFDQRSANGTWLENVRVEQALLQSGQHLRLGAVTFEVQVAGVPPMRPAGTLAPQPAVSPYGQPAYAPPAAAPAPQPPPAYPAPPQPAYQPQPMPPQPVAAPYPAPPQAPPQPAPYPQPSYPAAPPPGYPQMPAQVYAPPPPVPQQVPGAPAGPPRPVPASGSPGGGMTEAEAAEILGLWPGTPADEVKKRYQKLFNDFQIRITNAPTPALKKMYQKNIQDLRTAADVISPGAVV